MDDGDPRTNAVTPAGPGGSPALTIKAALVRP